MQAGTTSTHMKKGKLILQFSSLEDGGINKLLEMDNLSLVFIHYQNCQI